MFTFVISRQCARAYFIDEVDLADDAVGEESRPARPQICPVTPQILARSLHVDRVADFQE